MPVSDDSWDDEFPEFPRETWPKTCTCCGAKITEDDWETMSYCGVQNGDAEIGVPDLELRNCSCGTTLAIVLPRDFVDP